MSKKSYFLYKIIFPDFLLSMLFILLFSILNFKVDIVKSIYVVYFGLLFSLIDLIFKLIINKIQKIAFRKVTIEQIVSDQKNKILFLAFTFNVISLLLTFVSFFITKLIFNEFIVINSNFVVLLLALIIVIIRIVLSKVFKFDAMLLEGTQAKIRIELDEILDEFNDDDDIEEDVDGDLSDEEKVRKRLEKVLEQLEKKKEELENKEKNQDE